MKLPFRRKKDVSAVPAEIQEYYQSERRERTGVAWLLALGTLIITVGLATLLFFGGRWAYRAIANNDDKQETTQTEESTDNQVADTSDTQEPDQNNDSAQDGAQTGTSSTNTSTPNTPATNPESTTTPQNNNVAGSSTGLPNTGAGNIAAVFTATAAISAGAHYALTSRRTKE